MTRQNLKLAHPAFPAYDRVQNHVALYARLNVELLARESSNREAEIFASLVRLYRQEAALRAESIGFAQRVGLAAVRRDPREDDRRILEASALYRTRLANFIRRRVPDDAEAEDILQEVFYELVAAYRLFAPVEEAGAWLFRVARNRITDFFRKKKPEALADAINGRSVNADERGDSLRLEDMLPSPDAGPEAVYARGVLLDEIDSALDELPPEQRAAFVGHEFEGRSFKDLAAEAGVTVNAMVLRKHHAVLYLRRRLQAIRNEFLAGREQK